jgi:hypothetical protein
MYNFNDIPVDQIDPKTNYGQLVPVVAEVTKIVSQSQGYNIVGLRDFSGMEDKALVRGQVKPTLASIGQVIVLSLSATTKGQYTNYSGFYNPNDAVPQQFQGQRPPQAQPKQPAQARAGGGGRASGGGDTGKNRSMTLAYAKDLAVAGRIEVDKIPTYTKAFLAFVETGTFPTKSRPVQSFQPEPEREIPEIGGYQPEQSQDFGNEGTYAQQPVTDVFEQPEEYSEEDTPF